MVSYLLILVSSSSQQFSASASDALLHKKMCETKETALSEQELIIEKLKREKKKVMDG